MLGFESTARLLLQFCRRKLRKVSDTFCALKKHWELKAILAGILLRTLKSWKEIVRIKQFS